MAREQWLDRLRRILALDVGTHHVVFTVPHELIDIFRWNRSWFAAQVLGAARETLLQLLSQDRWLGALPGMVLSWQTWGRDLLVHPHVHVLLTAGGWTESGWKSLQHDFVVPSKVLRTVYRGKLQSRLLQGLATGEMVLPDDEDEVSMRRRLRRLYRKEWSVHVQPRYAHGRGVLMYLARYVRGGPLRDHQLQWMNATHVSIRHWDHATSKTVSLPLTIEDFLHRLSEHVPDPGFHVVRYAGLYASSHRAKLAQARSWLGMAPLPEAPPEPLTAQDVLERIGKQDAMSCSVCGRRYVQCEKIDPADRAPPSESYRWAA